MFLTLQSDLCVYLTFSSSFFPAFFKLGSHQSLDDYARTYENQFKDDKMHHVKASQPDGQSPITGFALLAFSLGAGCSSQKFAPSDDSKVSDSDSDSDSKHSKGRFISAPTAYFAYAVNTCFAGIDGTTYYMFQYDILGAFGVVALTEYNDALCETPVSADRFLPVNTCIQPTYGPTRRELQIGPNIPFVLASLQVYFVPGSRLPSIPVAVAKYSTYV